MKEKRNHDRIIYLLRRIDNSRMTRICLIRSKSRSRGFSRIFLRFFCFFFLFFFREFLEKIRKGKERKAIKASDGVVGILFRSVPFPPSFIRIRTAIWLAQGGYLFGSGAAYTYHRSRGTFSTKLTESRKWGHRDSRNVRITNGDSDIELPIRIIL